MSKIRVKNFGPIRNGLKENLADGFVNEWIDIKKVTIFIGNQGSGKSTLAKLISTLTWLEKDIVRGITVPEDVNTFKRFQRLLNYQRIGDYLSSESEIEYQGDALRLKFDGNKLNIDWTLSQLYGIPKIMYVPAERNFLAVVDRPDKLKSLPSPLFTFLDEYDSARNLYSSGLDIPIGNVSFKYDKQNKLARIVDNQGRYELHLSEAASGFQSTIPLYLVTKYLTEGVGKEKDTSVKELSLEEQRKQDAIKARIKNDKKLNSSQRERRYSLIDSLPSTFINIVEEPEQNLFPTSQRTIFEKLLEFNNKQDSNRLILTTHSPYLLSYLTMMVKGFLVKQTIDNNKEKHHLYDKLNSITPLKSLVSPKDWVVYELNDDNGSIVTLENYKGLPEDNHFLNKWLNNINNEFDNLREIEKC